MANDYQERFNRIERSIEFVAAQQAKFSADLEKINATIDKHSEVIGGLLQASQALVDHEKAAEGPIARLEEKMADMFQAHRETEERLSAFITFVERYISSHNGH